MNRILLFPMLLAVLFSGCQPEDHAVLSDKGTVRYLALEGGFFGIIDDHDRHLDPTNLPEQYRVDSLRVEFTARNIPDAVSFHMWGQIVEIIRIKKIP